MEDVFVTAAMTEVILHALLMFFYFCAEKRNTALWIMALLPKQHCLRTTIQCWAHTTQKTTSLCVKQVQNHTRVLLRYC